MASDFPRSEPASATPAGSSAPSQQPRQAEAAQDSSTLADTALPATALAGTALKDAALEGAAPTGAGLAGAVLPGSALPATALAGAPRPGRLDIGDAIHDGWQAFCRAPRVFAVYALLVNLLIVLQQPLLWRIGDVAQPSGDLRDWAQYGLGLVVVACVFLWGCIGLERGARLALQGRRPNLRQLLQWDGRAWMRLLRSWLRLVALVGLPAGAALILFGLLMLLQAATDVQLLLGQVGTRLLALLLAALMLLSLALTLVTLLYLAVNQMFLVQIVVMENRGGDAALQRGRQLVDPQWPLVLLLLIVTTLLNGLGLLACAVGSLVAWPAVVCISTAAYQQLRQSEARADLEPAPMPAGSGGGGSAGPGAADR